MEAHELNRRLAEALGWETLDGGLMRRPDADVTNGIWTVLYFATSRDDLAEYVLPRIKSMGLQHHLMCALGGVYPKIHGLPWWDAWFTVLTAPPYVLAEAALRVLEVKE